MTGPSGDPTTWSNDQWMQWYDEVLRVDPKWQRVRVRSARPENPELAEVLRGVDRLMWTYEGVDGTRWFLGAMRAESLSPKEAFEYLGVESRLLLHRWITTEPPAGTAPVPESIIDELEPIVIGVPGNPGVPSILDELEPPGEPPAEEPPVDTMAEPPPSSSTVAQPAGPMDPYEAVEEPRDPDDPMPGWDSPEDPTVNITLPNDNVATVTGRPDHDPDVHIPGVTDQDPTEDPFATAPPTITLGPQGPPVEPGDVEQRGCLPAPMQTITLVVAVLLLAVGAYWVFLDGGDGGEPAESGASTGEREEPEFAELEEPFEPVEAVEEPALPPAGTPVPIQPCDVLTAEEIGAIAGNPVAPGRIADEGDGPRPGEQPSGQPATSGRYTCVFDSAGPLAATIQISVFGPAPEFDTTWLDRNADDGEAIEQPYADVGTMRIEEGFGEDVIGEQAVTFTTSRPWIHVGLLGDDGQNIGIQGTMGFERIDDPLADDPDPDSSVWVRTLEGAVRLTYEALVAAQPD